MPEREHVQCILLIGCGKRRAGSLPNNRRNFPATAYALLPKIFTDIRPEINDFFLKNSIEVVQDSTDPKDMFANARQRYRLDIFEVRLVDIDVKRKITGPLTVHVKEGEFSKGAASLLFQKRVRRVSCVSFYGGTFTYSAIDDRSLRFIETCLSHGVEFGYRHIYEGTPLHFAVENNSHALLKMFLRNGYDVNEPQSNCFTPLHLAARNGQFQMLKTLILNGANVDGNSRVIESKCGAYLNGETPLLLATKNDHSEVIKYLLENGASVNVENHYGRDGCSFPHDPTPLHLAARDGHLQVVEALVKGSSNINAEASDDYAWCFTPLMHAAKNGNLEVVNLLLERGANVNGIQTQDSSIEDGNDQDSDGITALHMAAEYGREETVKFLVNRGANVNAETKEGLIPAHEAATNGHTQIVKILIDAGAKINAEYRDYLDREVDLLLIALRKHNKELFDFLLSRRSDLNNKCITRAFYFALTSESKFCTDNLCHICPEGFVFNDENLQNVDMVILLFGAILKDLPDLVEQLLKRGVDANSSKLANNVRITALDAAAAANFDGKIVRMLIEYGADVDSVGENNGTFPLLFAVLRNNINALKALISKKANFRENSLVLFAAIFRSNPQILETLLLNGLDLSVRMETEVSAGLASVMVTDRRKLRMILKFGSYPRNSENHSFSVSQPSNSELGNWPESLLIIRSAMTIGRAENIQTFLDFFFHDVYCARSLLCCRQHSPALSKWNSAIGHQIVKMISAGLLDGCEIVHVASLLGSAELVADYRSSCKTEVRSMKNTRVPGTNISFYDILIQDVGSISKYLRNENIQREFQTSSYKAQFPLYGSILEWQLEKGAHRRFLVNRGIRIFTVLFKQFSTLPFDLKEKIVDLLGNQDLHMLVCI
ncbi:unnamed protein product [Bemisia tabaci]|uniref:PRANC domain-containing protein n=1 Tax=Bemisia tabaci TaxID=7038 RepID=A0A9P0ALI4_BEMTA|nr:unnamed protein product [Bemisia tabaci]